MCLQKLRSVVKIRALLFGETGQTSGTMKVANLGNFWAFVCY